MKWLLVGAGDIARKRVAPALSGAPGSTLCAVCDVNAAGARALAAGHGGIPAYEDFGRALAESGCDAVYVATPVWLHAEQAAAALHAGKHVLVEKPLGLSAAGARAASAAARISGKTAGCAYFRRLSARYLHAREALASGRLGTIVLVRMSYTSWFAPAADDTKAWRVVREKSGGGPVSDMGSHMFDVIVGLFGLPRSVDARCTNLVHPWDVEDTASMLMTWPGGLTATASFSWASRTWRHDMEIVGTEARIAWLPYDSGPVAQTVGRDTTLLDLPPADNVHLPLVADFVEAARAGRPPACPIEEALKTNLLMDAVYHSARVGGEVAVEPA